MWASALVAASVRAAEVASIGVAAWASRTVCPAVHCAEIPPCPSCPTLTCGSLVCDRAGGVHSSGASTCPVLDCSEAAEYPWGLLLVLLVSAFLAGLGLGRLSARPGAADAEASAPSIVVGTPLPALTSDASVSSPGLALALRRRSRD